MGDTGNADRCPACGHPLNDKHTEARCQQARWEWERGACEASGHVVQGDTCYCGAVSR